MSLTKTTTVDQITVTENGTVLYREATRIMEDGNQISQTYHRSSLTPAQDLTGVPANVGEWDQGEELPRQVIKVQHPFQNILHIFPRRLVCSERILFCVP